ncbi:MAG TPA: hypothetical protein VMT91_12895 [Anaerolineales bacterium]|nr:hypothetical protein [Anaerolineales bacterium]
MTKTEATAEVFWMAFKVLLFNEKRAVIQHIIRDESLRRDSMDLALIKEHRDEPGRSSRNYLNEKCN